MNVTWRFRRAVAATLLVACAVIGTHITAAERSSAETGRGAAADREDLPAVGWSPRFLFSEEPAMLILIDGSPVYRPIPETDLQRIVNTNAFIVRDDAGIHYLKLFDGWMEAYSLTGTWSVAGVPPTGAEQALRPAVASNTADLLRRGAAEQPAAATTLAAEPPVIFVSTEPAELIVTDGPPRFVTVAGTSLEYIENTTAHVFREPTDQELYVLSSGRWSRAWTTDGPWELVPASDLPADIAAIQAALRK